MGEAVDKILTGQFAPAPFYRGRSHDPCSYCDYAEVCQKTPEFRKTHYQESMTADEFWEKLGGKEDE
jgi:ATP-dependent helicase/DNAse subunit B